MTFQSNQFIAFTDPPPPVLDGPTAVAPAAPAPQQDLIAIVVIALGALIAIPALLGLVIGTTYLSYGFLGGGAAVLAAIDLLYLLLGVGLMARRELARSAYVVLALVGLVLNVVGLVGFVALQPGGAGHGEYAGLLLGFIVSTLPLWFLTRESVRETFS